MRMRRYPNEWDFVQPSPSRLESLKDEIEFLEEWKKKEELKEKDKKDKEKAKKVEFPKFSLLETFSLATVASFVVGPVLGYFYLKFMITFISQLGVLLPLLQSKP